MFVNLSSVFDTWDCHMLTSCLIQSLPKDSIAFNGPWMRPMMSVGDTFHGDGEAHGKAQFPSLFLYALWTFTYKALIWAAKQLWVLVLTHKYHMSPETKFCVITEHSVLHCYHLARHTGSCCSICEGAFSLCCDSLCLCTTGAQLKRRSLNKGAVLFSCNRKICKAFQQANKI